MSYTVEDKKLIQEEWEDLLVVCENIYKNDEDRELVKRAFFLAREAHQGVRRRSGEPYFLHPIAVAKIAVTEIGLGVKAVVASLLHDVVEDTEYTVEDIERIFGSKIALIVDGLTKMSGVFNTDTSEQAEYFRKVLLTLSDDVRVILIKIADRLHNMRTLDSMPTNKQVKITGETVYLFIPLAYKLGLFSIKSELEDLCMKYRLPEQYKEITQKIAETEEHRQEYIKKFTTPIISTLDRDNIKYEISGRVKSVFSIWRKMQRKGIPFEEIYDLFAVRVVFQATPYPSEKTQCWHIYNSIADVYEPNTNRRRDWLYTHKANGYEALHGTFMGPDGIWVEVQIRTQRMDDIAERGLAAHWKYKGNTISKNEDEFEKWLKLIRVALNSPTENAVDFLDNFKLSLYTTEIVVFTPKGESRKIPFGATALDFAYDIHSKIGYKAIGAKINYKLEPLNTKINSGDQVEIITLDTACPKAEWLDFVVTAKAKQSINNFLRQDRQSNIEKGIEILEERGKNLKVKFNGHLLKKIISASNCNNKEELYNNIGAGIISNDNLDKIIKTNSKSKIFPSWTLFITKQNDKDKGGDIADLGDEKSDEIDKKSPTFEIAACCSPIPGDDVVGFRDPKTDNIIAHKSTCQDLNKLAAQFGKFIVKDEIKWSQHKSVSYLSSILMRGIDRMGLLLELSTIVTNDFSINIREINIQTQDGIFEGNISLYVKDRNSLDALLTKLRKIKGIESVNRTLD